MAEAPSTPDPLRLLPTLLQEKSAWLEKRIRQEFDKLREFLRVEEQAILDAVAEETRQKQLLAEEKMKQLRENTKTLMQETERLQMEMKAADVSFLMVRSSLSSVSDRYWMFRNQWAVGDQQPQAPQSFRSFQTLGWRSSQTTPSAWVKRLKRSQSERSSLRNCQAIFPETAAFYIPANST